MDGWMNVDGWMDVDGWMGGCGQTDGCLIGNQISLRMSGSNRVKQVSTFFPCRTCQGLYYVNRCHESLRGGERQAEFLLLLRPQDSLYIESSHDASIVQSTLWQMPV